jgi:hypothetical protein
MIAHVRMWRKSRSFPCGTCQKRVLREEKQTVQKKKMRKGSELDAAADAVVVVVVIADDAVAAAVRPCATNAFNWAVMRRESDAGKNGTCAVTPVPWTHG